MFSMASSVVPIAFATVQRFDVLSFSKFPIDFFFQGSTGYLNTSSLLQFHETALKLSQIYAAFIPYLFF